ncbi:MAG: cobalt transporter [Alphaproteobacteria bacterium]|nr:MAG: cobalt transporter [Alphaproteobacteria bacterium]
MIARVLLAAVIAGMIAGAAATAVQMWRVVPLILQAETFETAGSGHSHAATPGAGDRHETGSGGHVHETEPWAPADGLERSLFTFLANVVTGAAFALLLTAAVMFTGRDINAASGFVWGVLGFVVFVLAPTAGLAPELPGMPAAELVARQSWWWATVAATAGGIALIVLVSKWPARLLGGVLIAAPHIIGAPQPESHESLVPASLAAEFAAASLASMALFWIILGVSVGWLLARVRSQPAA